MIFVIGLAVVIGSMMVTSAQEPLLTIESHYDGEKVNFDTITVSGYARGTGGAVVDLVTVNGVPATGTSLWSAEASLQPGPNPITVVAKDEMGEECSETITVYYQAQITPPIQLPRDDGAPSGTPTPTPKLTVSISITSIPSGATVYLDDFYKGTTPIRENVTVGHHKIKVTKEGYHSFSEPKKIRRGNGEPEEWIIELKPLTGSIYISSTPSGASVYLDSVDIKAITPCLLKVVVGPNTIKLTKSGYFDAIRNVSVPPDGLLSLHETLISCGYITISSDPPGAEVYLDGNYTGETPTNIIKVVVGNHTIKLTKSDYDDEIRNVSVSVGETLHLHENLTGYGSLCISSNPSGASVYIDGNCIGETPFDNDIVVVAGTHTYKLTKSYYADVEKTKHVSAGKLTTVDESLSLLAWLRALIDGGVMGVAIGVVIAGLFALPKWIIPILSNKKYLLFSVDPSHRQHLKDGDVDAKLKNVFKENKHSLSSEAKVSNIAKKQWKIVDGETQYRVDEDTGKRLNIYKKRSR
jgi:hypothetical protein